MKPAAKASTHAGSEANDRNGQKAMRVDSHGRREDHPDYSPFNNPGAGEKHREAQDAAQKRIEKWAARLYAVAALDGLKYPWARVYAAQLARFNATRDPMTMLPTLIFAGDKVAGKATDEQLADLGPELTVEQIAQWQLRAAAIREDARAQVKMMARTLATRRTRDQGDQEDAHNAGPGGLFFNVEALLDSGIVQPMPAVLTRQDGRCLFYKGKGNVIYGDPDTAKTWIALAAGAEVLLGGGKFAFLDLDHNGAGTVVDRLRMLGVPLPELRDPDRFLYVDPFDAQHVTEAVSALGKWGSDMVVIDSMGELLPMFGASSNSSDEFTNVNRAVVTPLAKAGAAAVVIDHMAKNAESRRLGTVGAYGKVRAVNGTMVRVFKVAHFIPGHGGVSSLWVHKDRSGSVVRETVAPDTDSDNGDGEDIKRDNLRRWGVFEMTSAPVFDPRNRRPKADGNGYAEEKLSWVIRPPKGLPTASEAIPGVDMPDLRHGGRPRGNGITVVGSEQYTDAVTHYLGALCRLMREGRATVQTSKTEATDLVTSVLGGTKPSREPWAEAWSRWKADDRPNDVANITPIAATDPFTLD